MSYRIEPGADLVGANLQGADLSGVRLSRSNLTKAHLIAANLIGADLSGANLSGTDLSVACLIEANLSGANLIGADLSGADLSRANLSGTIGIGTREGEIEFAKELLRRIEKDRSCFDMVVWHACETTHCIAGWAFPYERRPGQPASLLYPTLAKYFYSSDEVAIAAIRRVAAGEESAWN